MLVSIQSGIEVPAALQMLTFFLALFCLVQYKHFWMLHSIYASKDQNLSPCCSNLGKIGHFKQYVNFYVPLSNVFLFLFLNALLGFFNVYIFLFIFENFKLIQNMTVLITLLEILLEV